MNGAHLRKRLFSTLNIRIVARLDRKRLGQNLCEVLAVDPSVFDEQARRKPLAFAAGAGDAAGYGI
jgi:hypothetical protein